MWGVAGAAAVAAGYAVCVQILASGRLRDELRRLNVDAQAAREVRKENGVLKSKAEHLDLAALRRDRAEAGALRAEMAAARGALEKLGPANAPPQKAANAVVPIGSWKPSGNASPDAAFESVLWAATRGEVDRLAALIAFDPPSRAAADALFQGLSDADRAQYGTPERVVATMLAGSLPANLSAMEKLNGSGSADYASLWMKLQRSDGTFKETDFQFQREADGWRLLVPAGVVNAYAKSLASSGPTH
jgi:hypothetical protein